MDGDINVQNGKGSMGGIIINIGTGIPSAPEITVEAIEGEVVDNERDWPRD